MIGRLLKLAIVSTIAQSVSVQLFRRQRTRHASDRRHFLVTRGGSLLRPSADEMVDAVASVLMGGLELDLRQAPIGSPPARLELLCVMGGVVLIVPEHWKVRVDVEAVMGGIRDRRTGAVAADRPTDLVVSGRVVMGGLEICSSSTGSAKSASLSDPGLPHRSGPSMKSPLH
jgi:hypothetical protein